MEKPYLKVTKLKENAIIPTKRVEDGFFDLYGCYDEKALFLKPGDIKLISIGLAIEFPIDWTFRVFERGSTGSKGIALRCGVIDSGYRGECFIAINNTSNKLIIISDENIEEIKQNFKEEINGINDQDITLYPQKKAIAQGGLIYSPHIEIDEVESISDLNLETERQGGKLGSSNK